MIYIYNGGKIAQFFWQFVNVLEHELLDRGFEVKVIAELHSELPYNDLYILFGLQEIAAEWLKGRMYIIYNTEPLITEKWFWLISRMTGAIEIWCYNSFDAQVLNFRGLSARYFPFGYSKYFCCGDLEPDERYNQRDTIGGAVFLAFYINDIRAQKLHQLGNVRIVRDCWDAASYKKLVDTSFLHTSLTQFPVNNYTDPCRFIPLLANKCLILTEPVQREQDQRLTRLTVTCSDIAEMKSKIDYYLQNTEAAKEIIKEKYNWFSTEFTFDKLIKEAGCLEILANFTPRQYIYINLLKTALTFEAGASASASAISIEQLHTIQNCFTSVVRNGISGDIVEYGISNTSIFFAALIKFHDQQRKLYVVDDFEDRSIASGWNGPAVSLATVKNNFRNYQLLDDNIVFVKGDTGDVGIAILCVKNNSHPMILKILEQGYKKLAVGGYVIIHNYNSMPCKQAVQYFIEQNKIQCRIIAIDDCTVYFKRHPVP